MKLDERLQALLDETIEVDGNDVNVGDALSKVLLAKAIRGDTKALNMVMERAGGKPAQKLELEGQSGATIEIDSTKALQAINQRLEGLNTEGADSGSKGFNQD